MALRVKIISPIKVDEADLERRQRRYGEAVGEGVEVVVFNLMDGPPALNDEEDMRCCDRAVFAEGTRTVEEAFDAILIDCVYDPAVDAIAEATGLPTFGPMHTTLMLAAQIARRLAIVSRSQRQCEMMEELVRQYGYGEYLVATRALGLSYPEAKQPALFNRSMTEALHAVVEEDGAEAVLMGSTTMALDPEVEEAAKGVPLFLPGMVTIRVIESLWRQGLLPARETVAASQGAT